MLPPTNAWVPRADPGIITNSVLKPYFVKSPKSFAAHSNIEQGSVVDLSLDNGKMIVEAVKEQEYSLDELLARVTKNNLHAEVDFGAPVGKEAW